MERGAIDTRRPPVTKGRLDVSVPASPRSLLATAVVVGLSYYVAARVGFALTFRPYLVSTLWAPNAVLLAALLLTPVRSWWVVLLGAFPAHVVVELQATAFQWLSQSGTSATSVKS